MKRAISLPVFIAAAVGLGVLGFGAGFGVRAMADEKDEPATVASSPQTSGGGMDIGIGPKSLPTSLGAGQGEDGRSAGYGANDMIMANCQGDLPTAILPTGVDLAAAGITVKPLGPDFVPMSFSIRADTGCDVSVRDGVTPAAGDDADIVIDTIWRHRESGVQLTVSQRVSDEAVANTIRQNTAQFTSGGYNFTIYANIYYYAATDKPGVDPASSSSMPAPGGEVNIEVLLAAIRDIAPELGAQCFATEVNGDWANLAALGIGDPRGAVPSNTPLQYMSLLYLKAAEQNCGGAPLPSGSGANFNASWYGEKDQASVSVSVAAMDPSYRGGNAGGSINEHYAYWQAKGLQFNVYGNKANGGIGIDTIRAIAKALDPSFDDSCFVQEVKFDANKLSQYGLSAPKTPDGYKKGEENGSMTTLANGCTKPEGYADWFSYSVQYTDGDKNISVNINQYGAKEPGFTGYIGEGNINWITESGVNVSVAGYSMTSRTGGPSLDDLKAVARSIDPNVNFDKLQEGNGGIAVPMPAPAVDGGR